MRITKLKLFTFYSAFKVPSSGDVSPAFEIDFRVEPVRHPQKLSLHLDEKTVPNIGTAYTDLPIHWEQHVILLSGKTQAFTQFLFVLLSSAALVEMRGLEPLTSSVQGRRSPI
jgi:hypothetical protein